MKRSKATQKNSAFSRDDLLQAMKSLTSTPVTYVSKNENFGDYFEIDYDVMFDVLSKYESDDPNTLNLDITQDKIDKCCEKNMLKRSDMLLVKFCRKSRTYCIKKNHTQETLYIPNDSRESLKVLERFLKNGYSIHEKTECSICFDKIRNDVSFDTFMALNHTCQHCLNTICVSCYANTQEKNTSGVKHTCCFCRMECNVPDIYDVMLSNTRAVVPVDRVLYNKYITRINDMSKEGADEIDMKKELDALVLELKYSNIA